MKKVNLKRETLENQKGITILALIVTVIILIILAGITISTISGDNGIITNTSKAKFTTEVKDIQEQIELKEIKSNNGKEYQFGSLEEIIGISNEYNNKLCIEDGKLVYIPEKVSENEAKWLEEMDIKAKQNIIPIYTKEQFKKIGSNEEVEIEQLQGEKFVFTKEAHYALQNSIDLGCNDENQWNTLLNEYNNPFKGIFEGNNYTISGIYINDANKDNQSLFGYNSGTIQNLKVEGYIQANNYISGITIRNNGKIINCENRVEIYLNGHSAGGIVVENNGKIENCVNNAYLKLYAMAGGICGNNGANGKIIKCYNNHEITFVDFTLGGIVGNNEGIIEQCYNLRNINKVDKYSRYGKGGICGGNSNTGNIINCYNLGDLDAKGWSIGGITGSNAGNVEYSYNTGYISGPEYVGCLTGNNSGTIKNCYSIDNDIEIASENTGSIENTLILTEKQLQLKEKITLDNGQEVTLLELLNSNGVFWQEDEKNQNKGFPILIK